MAIIISLLEILSIVGIWYFWKKKPNKKGLIISIVLLFVFGGLYSTTGKYKADKQAQEASSSSMVSSSVKESKKNSSSVAASSEKKAKHSAAEKTNAKSSKASSKATSKSLSSNKDVKKAIQKSNPNLKITSVNGVYMDPKSKDVAVEIKGQDAVSEKLTTKGFLMDVRSVWFALKESGDSENFENVNVSVKFPMTDEAGNDSNEYVVKTGISGFKINNLNVKRFLFKNVPTYADNYWQYPNLPKVN